ncbi:MAG TPA: glycoside hydrolase family 25 protein [Candidatus Limnocylindrales bacterium]|nr:glycoside hydrolase family 25 protein [Candidatus Limnocylindrales bacterium]
MRRAYRSWLPFAAAALAVLVMLPSLAATTDAASSNWTAKCEARIRTSPKVTATTLKIIKAGAIVRAVGTVSGGSYKADCPTSVSGTSWLKITRINDKTAYSLFGRTYVYAAAKLFKSGPNPTATPKPTATPTPTPTPSTIDYVSNCSVRLRASASTSADTTAIIDTNTLVTASAKVSGSSWTADCATSVSGSSWYKITAVGGKSVSSLYGVSAVYAATGLFRSVSTSSSGYKEGIDVSHWQGTIDWTQVRAAGKTFAFAKATEGTSFLDDHYAKNKAGAMANGIMFGAYHFARPGSNDPVKEADWFVDNMGLQHGMMIPAMDLEVTGGLGVTALTNWTKAWLQRVADRTGVKPLIYTSPSFWRTYLNDSRWFADNGYSILWVAHWNVTSPSVPGSNWGGHSWTFWQYSSDGTVPGISGRVDLNRYHFDGFAPVTY